MVYLLILQFDAVTVADYDEFILLEKQLAAVLEGDEDIDGHDMGEGELNIFVITNTPAATFDRILSAMPTFRESSSFRAAFRAAKGDGAYTSLWPMDATSFSVK